MKVYQLKPRRDDRYAQLLSLYVKPDSSPVCGVCGFHDRLPELKLEWDPGSDLVPDFLSAGGRIVVRDTIIDHLMSRFTGILKRPLSFHDHPKLHRPKRITKRTKPCVWLPYEGPRLSEFSSVVRVPLLSTSTVQVRRWCRDCGRVTYKAFDCVGKKDSRGHVPRVPGKGLFFSASKVADNDIFIPEATGLILCTERVYPYLASCDYQNLDLLEVGDIVDE
jgi:hypothetical protein